MTPAELLYWMPTSRTPSQTKVALRKPGSGDHAPPTHGNVYGPDVRSCITTGDARCPGQLLGAGGLTARWPTCRIACGALYVPDSVLAGATSTPSRTEPAHTPRSRSAAAEYTCSDVWPPVTLNGKAFGLPDHGSVSSMPICTCAAAGNANAQASASAATDRRRGDRGMVGGGATRAGRRLPDRARSVAIPARAQLRRANDGQ